MYSDIKEQFRSVIRYSQGINDPQVDSLFTRWEASKQKFIERFGGLIYEWPEPVEFSLDANTKRSMAMEFANTVSDTFNNPVLAEFIDENIDTFFENKVSKVAENSQIPQGMKLIKAFKFFEPNKTTLREVQDMASQLIQENKIKGTLCFSVHPLDFLSSSENTYNWRSCHSLDGEYRAGNLSYMVDTTTFMVYLKGADNQRLYNFGEVLWNSKKWRMLIHASEDDEIMFAGRQYPFSSKSGIDLVLKIYNNLMYQSVPNLYYRHKYTGWKADYIDSYVPFGATDYSDQKELAYRYLVYHQELIRIDDLVEEGYNALNYNDVLQSTCYPYPYYATLPCGINRTVRRLIEHPIIVGDEVTCLECGCEAIRNPETMRCDDCELEFGTEENDVYTFCDCCGARIYVDDGISVNDGAGLVCEACNKTECFICDFCGETYFNDQRVFIPQREEWYCTHCYYNHGNDKEN